MVRAALAAIETGYARFWENELKFLVVGYSYYYCNGQDAGKANGNESAAGSQSPAWVDVRGDKVVSKGT